MSLAELTSRAPQGHCGTVRGWLLSNRWPTARHKGLVIAPLPGRPRQKRRERPTVWKQRLRTAWRQRRGELVTQSLPGELAFRLFAFRAKRVSDMRHRRGSLFDR